MSADAPESFDRSARVCVRLAHCPVCAEPNRCRLETGEAYQGPCWCEQPTLCAAAVRRLLSDLLEPRCLCRACLEGIAANPEITWDELAQRPPCSASSQVGVGDFYMEGATLIFTAQFHLRRGSCCGSGCRHCPFEAPV